MSAFDVKVHVTFPSVSDRIVAGMGRSLTRDVKSLELRSEFLNESKILIE